MKRKAPSNLPAANETPASGFSRKHILVVAFLTIGLILGALGGFTVHERRDTPAATADAPKLSEKRRRDVDFRSEKSREWQWPDSGATTYQIHQKINIAPGDSELAPETLGTTIIEGKLHVALAAADESSVTLALQLGQVSYTVDPAGDEAARREPVIEKMLNSNAGLLQLERNGRVIGCRLPAALADRDRAMLEGVFAVQFVLGEGSRWESKEESQGVRFLSSYQNGGKQTVLKSRQVLPGTGTGPTMRIVTSRTTALPGPFWIESLESAERLECIWKDQIVCTAETTTSMRRIASDEMPEALADLVREPAKHQSLISSAALVSTDNSVRDSAIERQRIARLVETYQSIPASRMIEDLVKTVDAATDHEQTIPTMHAVRDWLIANPTRSGEIAAALATPGFSDRVTARIAHALELAGKTNPEAQAALASVIKSAPGTYPSDAILQSVVAAGGVGRVLSPDLMPALSDLATAETHGDSYELSNAALYALGSLARENPDLQRSLVDTLSPWLDAKTENNAENTTAALLALANAKSEDPVIMQKAIALGKNHEFEDVRMAAIDLLSASRQAQAIEAIGQILASDPSEAVRKHTIISLTRPETVSSATLRPILGFLRKGSGAETIRSFAIASLTSLQSNFPEIHESLRN